MHLYTLSDMQSKYQNMCKACATFLLASRFDHGAGTAQARQPLYMCAAGACRRQAGQSVYRAHRSIQKKRQDMLGKCKLCSLCADQSEICFMLDAPHVQLAEAHAAVAALHADVA